MPALARWSHQNRGVSSVLAAIRAGTRRIVLTSPTGAGKSVMIQDLIAHYLRLNRRAILYTNRKMLLEQLSKGMREAGFEFGVRAAGHEEKRDLPFQISSMQTENARVLKKEFGGWGLHRADLVLVDECHVQTGDVAQEILARHFADGAAVAGVTATPLGLHDMYDELVVAGTVSELRECGALVRAVHKACLEPDLRTLKLKEGEEPSENQLRKHYKSQAIIGDVFAKYNEYNPERKPAILFASGVAESLWFAQEFSRRGVRAAHIDGDIIWLDGRQYKNGQELRNDILNESKSGLLPVICNRFVMREGIDCPWLEHCIFATVFGGLGTYLQAGGRILRSHPGVARVTVQDHGGNWWRHGSLNADRTWDLTYTNAICAGLRRMSFEDGTAKEPTRCPKCETVLMGSVCSCGHVITRFRKSRPVVMLNGDIVEVEGDAFKPKVRRSKPDTAERWKKLYWRGKNSKVTFGQLAGLFAKENYYHPPLTLPMMPEFPLDWFRQVRAVPMERLRK